MPGLHQLTWFLLRADLGARPCASSATSRAAERGVCMCVRVHAGPSSASEGRFKRCPGAGAMSLGQGNRLKHCFWRPRAAEFHCLLFREVSGGNDVHKLAESSAEHNMITTSMNVQVSLLCLDVT